MFLMMIFEAIIAVAHKSNSSSRPDAGAGQAEKQHCSCIKIFLHAACLGKPHITCVLISICKLNLAVVCMCLYLKYCRC
jgi:hypothetical protein